MTVSLNASPSEHVGEVLDFHQHGVDRCSMVILQIDGNAPFECCVLLDELHIERDAPGAAATASEGEETTDMLIGGSFTMESTDRRHAQGALESWVGQEDQP